MIRRAGVCLRAAALCTTWIACATSVAAQSEHHHEGMAMDAPAWKFSWDARVFTGWNYQYRKFTDFQRIESQNWLMAEAQHPVGTGRIRFNGMISLEPFTIQPLGSPEVFQTGETYQQAPLIDYQHPHDLFMEIGVVYDRTVNAFRTFFEVD